MIQSPGGVDEQAIASNMPPNDAIKLLDSNETKATCERSLENDCLELIINT